MQHEAFKPSELPDDFRLLDDETLLHVASITPTVPQRKPSSLREFYRLTSAKNDSEVGANGPAVAALALETDQPIPQHQGLYDVVFGRDALRVAIDLARHYPRLAESTILTLAKLQGTTYDTHHEEEPGRIIHEARDPDDPIAQELTKRLGWQWPYYGSVDATPEFIRTLSAYCRLAEENKGFLFQHYTDKDGRPRIIADALTFAVDWILQRMDQNPEDLLEFRAAFPHSIENQVWKDSWDAYHHADGTLANHKKGIASIEVQTVTHDALLDAANLYETVLNRQEAAEALRERAHKLGRVILDRFWTDEKGGYFVLGTDRSDTGTLRQLKIRTSNMGHVLNSHLLEGDSEEYVHKRNAVLNQLMSPEMLAISGIRTLACDERRYRAGAYHNGSVWIWDTHHVAKGARRHSTTDTRFGAFADELDQRILQVVNTTGSFPEYVRGGDAIATNTRIIDVRDKTSRRINRVEQPPQEVQAWTVAAILATKRRRDERGLPL
jgi:glycogen debranching enzyme